MRRWSGEPGGPDIPGAFSPGPTSRVGDTRAIGPTPNAGRPPPDDVARLPLDDAEPGGPDDERPLLPRGSRRSGRPCRSRCRPTGSARRGAAGSWIASLHSLPRVQAANDGIVTGARGARVQRSESGQRRGPEAERFRRTTLRQGSDRSAGIVRQSASMTSRRDQRQTHVRPRPPSTGRPAPAKVKPRNPGPVRISTHRPTDRGGRSPLIARMGLIALVLALGAVVFYVGLESFPRPRAVSDRLCRGSSATSRSTDAEAVGRPDRRRADARAARRAVQLRDDRRSAGHRSEAARREPGLSDPRLPVTAGPIADPASGGRSRPASRRR